jgi:hypothetical protein
VHHKPESCPTPVAKINDVADIRKGALATLVGSNTEATLTNADFIFAWSQTAGTPIATLTGAEKPSASFTALNVNAITAFAFSKISLKADTLSPTRPL